jgi:hypothetical protein
MKGDKMNTHWRRLCFLIPALLIASSSFVFGANCPNFDLNDDCIIDLYDVDLFVNQWLENDECEGEGPCANFNGVNPIDFADYVYLAAFWQFQGKPIYINEFMAANNSDSNIADPYGDYDDWIEIYNDGNTAIDLAGMYLTDDPGDPTKWQIPSGYSAQTTIPAHGFVVFWADEEPGEGPLHADFKLSGDGEDIALFDTDGSTLIDSIEFGQQTTNISYGRYPEASTDLRFFSTPTPLADNNGAYIGEIERVEFSKERGFYDASFTLTLACVTPGVDIYYTIDGRNPIAGETSAPGSILYTTPFNINSSTPIRAAALKTGWMPSPVETHTYIFGATDEQKAMPVFSIVGDHNESLYPPHGVMAYPTMRGITYERPVSFEVFNTPADSNYQGDCGIRVQGSDYHRNHYITPPGSNWLGNYNYNKYSFRLIFRDTYGKSRFDYPMFPLSDIEREKCIVVRGGHNDAGNPFVKDEFARRLHRDMGVCEITGTIGNLFLNGVYKAYYNPCEHVDEEFLQEWYGSDKEWDVITQFGTVRDGDNTAWNAMLNYVRNNDLSNSANYSHAGTLLDIESYIDYLIVVLYAGNSDWPNNNWTAAAEHSENGIFRFFVWDTELAMDSSSINLVGFNVWPTYAGNSGLNGEQTELAYIYRALKVSDEFKLHFADRIHKHFNNGGVMTNEHMLARFSELRDDVNSVINPYPFDNYIANTWIPQRRAVLFNAFRTEDLLGPFEAPVYNVNSSYMHGGYVSTSDTITITDPCSTGGTIYYTTDGSDPRLSAAGSGSPPTQITYIADSAAKKVKVPTSDIGTTWRGGSEPYDDSGWTSGTSGVGYERDSGYDPYIGIDVESAMYNNNGTCYIRIPFNVDAEDIGSITSLTLKMRYDDGFVAYINGTEVQRVNFTSTPQWNSTASGSHEASSAFDSYDISSYTGNLQAGTNILAIHGLNYSSGSSDFLISSELEAVFSTVIEPNISPSAIEYTGGFTLNKSTDLKSRIYKSSTSQWSPLNEAVYGITGTGNNLRITEIMYNALDTVEPNDEDTEYIELKNIGGSSINLNLISFDNGINFTFGPNTLSAGQYILVVKDINAFETKYGTGRYIAGQYTGSLDNGGERIRLLDAVGTPIHDFKYKDGWRSIADGDGYSLTIINPANSDINSWGSKESWRASAYVNGSPGWDDSGIIPNPGDIVINEVMSHSHAGAPDWIELYNTTASSIDIGGWYLSDSDSNVMKYRFATGTSIPANGYLVVSEDVNFGEAATDPGKLIPFALSENGEVVILTSALDANSMLTGYREKEDFGASETGVSFGRYYKSSTDSYNFVPMDHNTPGAANAYPKVGPIVITEIMYHPDWPTGGNYVNDEYEYIELRNTSGASVTLYDSVENAPWKFTSGIDYTFPSPPSTVTIPAGGRILVVKNPTAFNWRYPGLSSITYGPYNGWLANDGEQLELGKPGDLDELAQRQYIRVERVNYSDGSHPGDEPDQWPINADGLGKSLTRTSQSLYGNDPNNWTAATPTPGT